jgi:phosphoribosylaminoimidazole-succinocarboxamide synthase
MTDEVVNNISERYIELYENVTGQSFTKLDISEAETEKHIIEALQHLDA